MKPLSILLVTRNAAEFLPQTIKCSLACESEFGAEIIAVDGNSSDQTWEMLKAQKNWLVEQQREPGLAAARNEALALAQSEFIAFHDADDEWLEGKISAQLQFLNDHPDTEVVTCLLKRIGKDETEEEVPAWTPSACLFRKQAFEKVGLFDSRYKIGCDHDWYVRAQRAGLKMEVIEKCYMLKNIHHDNLSNNRAAYRKELFNILRSRD